MAQIQSGELVDLLQICELPDDPPADALELVQAAAQLVKRWKDECAPAAAVALAAIMHGGRWRFGRDIEVLKTQGMGWIKYGDLVLVVSQFRGLIIGSEYADRFAREAVSDAVSSCWIRERPYQWETLLQVQPLGLMRVRELAPPATPQMPDNPNTMPTEDFPSDDPQALPAEEHEADRAVLLAMIEGDITKAVERTADASENAPARGRLTKDESAALKAKMLALISEHPSLQRDMPRLARDIGVNERTIRRWLENESKSFHQRRRESQAVDGEE